MEKEEAMKHYGKDCVARLASIGDALYAIGGKWKLRIIVVLQERKSRFNELQRTITGISSKVLASELRELELNGFVKRQDIRKLKLDELTEFFVEHGEKPFRAKQVYEWLWNKSAKSFDQAPSNSGCH